MIKKYLPYVLIAPFILVLLSGFGFLAYKEPLAFTFVVGVVVIAVSFIVGLLILGERSTGRRYGKKGRL